MHDLSILTVCGPTDPFAQVRERLIGQHTSIPYERLIATTQGGGSRAHGAALDELVAKAQGEYVAIFDSDAFPIKPWCHYGEPKTVVGIRHPRGYAHPSFWMAPADIAKTVSFRCRQGLDVAEAAHRELADRNTRIVLLCCTSFDVANPIEGDPPLGAIYDRTIAHLWYSTRCDLEGDPDGIPGHLIRQVRDSWLTRYA